MKRREILTSAMAVAAALALTAPAGADPAKLTAAEIESTLSGNTVRGEFSGGEYKQYFAEDGTTMYVPNGGEADPGKWRVNAETDEYESWWAATGWTPYTIERDGDTLVWINEDGDRSTSEILEGKQVEWEGAAPSDS